MNEVVFTTGVIGGWFVVVLAVLIGTILFVLGLLLFDKLVAYRPPKTYYSDHPCPNNKLTDNDKRILFESYDKQSIGHCKSDYCWGPQTACEHRLIGKTYDTTCPNGCGIVKFKANALEQLYYDLPDDFAGLDSCLQMPCCAPHDPCIIRHPYYSFKGGACDESRRAEDD
jgi:hypothetical protein